MRWFYWRKGKKTSVSVTISMGSEYRTYGDDLVKYLRNQLRLDTMREARDFLNCPMERDSYEAKIAPKMGWGSNS